jgi:hypothetical protein
MRILKALLLAGAVAMTFVIGDHARAADDVMIERLATCQDSWIDWKTDPAQMKKLVDRFRADFVQKRDTDAFFVPRASMTILGLPVTQVYPESIGMAVGFSVVVNANFETTKAALAKRLGHPIDKCEPPSDNMRTCEREIAEKKTILLMAEDDPKSTTALFGCYYFYEK